MTCAHPLCASAVRSGDRAEAGLRSGGTTVLTEKRRACLLHLSRVGHLHVLLIDAQELFDDLLVLEFAE